MKTSYSSVLSPLIWSKAQFGPRFSIIGRSRGKGAGICSTINADVPDPAQVCQSPVKLQLEGLDLSPLSRPGKGLGLDSATNADLAGKDRAKVLPHHRGQTVPGKGMVLLIPSLLMSIEKLALPLGLPFGPAGPLHAALE